MRLVILSVFLILKSFENLMKAMDSLSEKNRHATITQYFYILWGLEDSYTPITYPQTPS